MNGGSVRIETSPARHIDTCVMRRGCQAPSCALSRLTGKCSGLPSQRGFIVGREYDADRCQYTSACTKSLMTHRVLRPRNESGPRTEPEVAPPRALPSEPGGSLSAPRGSCANAGAGRRARTAERSAFVRPVRLSKSQLDAARASRAFRASGRPNMAPTLEELLAAVEDRGSSSQLTTFCIQASPSVTRRAQRLCRALVRSTAAE